MKGVYSSADQTNYRVAVQSIFPNNHLQHDSGGDPEAIPDLTYEEFKVRVAIRFPELIECSMLQSHIMIHEAQSANSSLF